GLRPVSPEPDDGVHGRAAALGVAGEPLPPAARPGAVGTRAIRLGRGAPARSGRPPRCGAGGRLTTEAGHGPRGDPEARSDQPAFALFSADPGRAARRERPAG